MTRRQLLATSLVATALLAGNVIPPALATQGDTAGITSVGSLRLIGERDLPNDLMVDDTLVGGLSGLDYDPATDRWIVLSDDRSDEAPARFYDATLDYDESAFSGAELTAATTLLQEDGTPFPNVDQGGNIPDPEAIRVDPRSGNYYWTSEGSQALGIDPGVSITAPDGSFVGSLPVDDVFDADVNGQTGIRDNGAFEGLTFSPDGSSYFVSTELPLFQDGDAPTGDTGSVNRITQYDRDGNELAQYAYEADAVPNVGDGELFMINGVTEILAVTDTTMLLIERGTVQAADESYANDIRLYEIDLTDATDISGVDSLMGADYTPVGKRLVEEFDGSDFPIDNIETLAFGPVLASGNPSLVLGSDNNFSDTQLTQFLAFEVLPVGAVATPAATPEGTPVVEVGTGQDQDPDSATPVATPTLDATPGAGTPETEVGTGQDQDPDSATPVATPEV